MSGIETYGGCCPRCQKGMQQKWNSSFEGLLFDACPWCGFAYDGGKKPLTEEDAKSLWTVILEHAHVASREELIQKYNLKPYVSREESDFYPSLFNYSFIQGTLPIYKYLWACQRKCLDSSSVLDQVVGHRVCWKDSQEQEGTIMEIKDGKVFILWDEHKGTKLPYFEYPLSDIGIQILPISPESFAGEQAAELKYVVAMNDEGYVDYRVDLGDSKKTYTNDLERATKYDREEDFAGRLGANERIIPVMFQKGQWVRQ
ncbi:hypothetical protein [Paenibacillus taichungensis]